MRSPSRFRHECGYASRQRGVVLFIALIALVVMSLAAVALIRSVDTSTLIAGNLAFKQSASSSGDAGLESAIFAVSAIQMANASKEVKTDPTHTLNLTDQTNGYYSNLDTGLSLTDGTGIQWDDNDSALVTASDSSGNEVRYIVQRMCRIANALLAPDCLYGGTATDLGGERKVMEANLVCTTCQISGLAVMYRITARIRGPRNTVSYVQSFVY